MQVLCHRAVVRRKELVRGLDVLGVAAQQGRDAALGGAVAQQQELCPLHRPLAVTDVAGVDLPDEGAHLFQRVPLLLDEGTHPGCCLTGGTALHPGIIQGQLGQIILLAGIQPFFQISAVIEQVVAGLEAVVGRRHHLFLVLVEQFQHLLRGAVAGEPVDVVADGRIERPQGAVQGFQVGSHLPQNVLVGAFLLPDSLQQLPGLVQLAGVGDDPGIQDLFQRFQQRGDLRHKGQGGFALVAAGLLFQPAGAAQPQKKAHRQRVGVPGGLFLFLPGPIGVQRQGLCQRGKIILGPGDGFRPGNAVVCRMAALFPQQEQQLRIKCPVRPRQRAEQPWADQFKQLHGNVLSVHDWISCLLYHKWAEFVTKWRKKAGERLLPGKLHAIGNSTVVLGSSCRTVRSGVRVHFNCHADIGVALHDLGCHADLGPVADCGNVHVFILRMYYAENIIQDLSNTFNLYDHTNRIHSSIVTVYLDRIQYIQPPGIHVHSGIQECFCFLLQFRVIGQLIRAFCVDGIHGFGFCLCLCAGSRPAGAGCEQQHPPMSTPMCQNFVQNRAEITQFHHVWVVK